MIDKSFLVRITTNAKSNQIDGFIDDRLKIRINATPEDNKANDAIIKFLSKILNINKSQIEIIKGKTTRDKTILLKNVPSNILDSF